LSPRATAHVAWMYVEQAYSLACGNYMYRYPERSATADAEIRSSVTAANRLFDRVDDEDPLLGIAARLGKCSLPIFEATLTHQPVTERHRQDQKTGHAQATQLLFDHYKQTRRIQDIPLINGMLGYMVLADCMPRIQCQALPSPLRSLETGLLAGRWHTAIYDPRAERMRKVRVGLDAPNDTIVLLPSLLAHTELSANHELGFLESYAQVLNTPASLTRHTPVGNHVEQVTQRLQTYLQERLSGVVKIVNTTYEPGAWYKTLPPVRAATDPMLGQTLQRAIHTLELQYANDKLGPEDMATLAEMYMEFALGSESLMTRPHNELTETLRYAQNLAEQARDELPKATVEHFRAAYMAPALGLYADLVQGVVSDEHVDAYGTQLVETAESVYATYQALPDKNTEEAKDMARLLQELTISLVAVTHPEKQYVTLPASRRQQGTRFGMRGFDFTVWRKTNDTYAMGAFKGLVLAGGKGAGSKLRQGRTNWEMVTFSTSLLDQDRPADKFGTLRAFCTMVKSETPTHGGLKKIRKAQQKVWELFRVATDEW